MPSKTLPIVIRQYLDTRQVLNCNSRTLQLYLPTSVMQNRSACCNSGCLQPKSVTRGTASTPKKPSCRDLSYLLLLMTFSDEVARPLWLLFPLRARAASTSMTPRASGVYNSPSKRLVPAFLPELGGPLASVSYREDSGPGLYGVGEHYWVHLGLDPSDSQRSQVSAPRSAVQGFKLVSPVGDSPQKKCRAQLSPRITHIQDEGIM